MTMMIFELKKKKMFTYKNLRSSSQNRILTLSKTKLLLAIKKINGTLLYGSLILFFL